MTTFASVCIISMQTHLEGNSPNEDDRFTQPLEKGIAVGFLHSFMETKGGLKDKDEG